MKKKQNNKQTNRKKHRFDQKIITHSSVNLCFKKQNKPKRRTLKNYKNLQVILKKQHAAKDETAI